MNYWDNWYSENSAKTAPTSFCNFCVENYVGSGSLVELGCGNGRDSTRLSDISTVFAIDLSKEAISNIPKKEGLTGMVGEFNLIKTFANLDYVYSRFSMHCINDIDRNILLHDIYTSLKPGGLLMLEARSDRIACDVIHNNHERYLLNYADTLKNINEIGFNIEEAAENTGLAVYSLDDKVEDPYIIRVIAKK